MGKIHLLHYSDIIMGVMASEITSLMIVYSTVYSGADERKYESSASLAFVPGIHQWLVNSPHKIASNAENAYIWWHHHGNHILEWNAIISSSTHYLNTLRPRQNGRHFSSIGYELDAPYQAQAQFPLPSAILDGVTSVPEAKIAPAPVMEHQARSPCPGYPVSDVGSHH